MNWAGCVNCVKKPTKQKALKNHAHETALCGLVSLMSYHGLPKLPAPESVSARRMCCCQTRDKPVAGFQLMSPFFFLYIKKKKHLIHPCWPPWFPKEGPAASSLFIIISLWLPPSALDPGRSWHRQPWPIKPYILFNLLSSDRPQFKGRPGLWDGHTIEKWAR